MEHEILSIKSELEKLRNHSDLNKRYREQDRGILLNIENTLIGNNLNGNKGIVFLIQDIDTRVQFLEKQWLENNVYQKQLKFVIASVVVILLGIFIQSVRNGTQLEDVKKIEQKR